MKYYKVKYSKQAEKFIKKNRVVGIRFFKAFYDISSSVSNVSKYDIKRYISKNYDDIFRLRIGQYRAIFRISNDAMVIKVFTIDARGQIYKKDI